METGCVFDIQHFSINNGPGIRTTAFLKGCPLRCVWCHNPESFAPQPQPRYMEKLCAHCGACLRACPNGALYLQGNRLQKDSARCTNCGRCAQACVYGAMTMWGRRMTAQSLAEELALDAPFFRASGGGVTFSGGEATAQFPFLLAVLDRLRQQQIHTAVDTNGFLPEDKFQLLLQHTDYLLFDIKQMLPEAHLRCTGTDNALILKNLDTLLRCGFPAVLRYPMIPGLTDSEENITAMCRFLTKRGVTEVDVSVFHDYYTEKYVQLFTPEAAPEIPHYTQAEIQQRLHFMEAHGVHGRVL